MHYGKQLKSEQQDYYMRVFSPTKLETTTFKSITNWPLFDSHSNYRIQDRQVLNAMYLSTDLLFIMITFSIRE